MSGPIESVSFALRFVLRDTRGSWGRFVWFSILLGTSLALLMASQGAASALREAILESARDLVGADIVVSSKSQIPSRIAENSGGRSALEYRIRTMVRSGSAAQLAQVRAIDDSYPFFGTIQTEPPETQWRAHGGAVLERVLMDRLGIKVGDPIEVLGVSTKVAAQLVSAPGDISAAYVVAPRLYLSRNIIPKSVLEERGSMVDYSLFIALENPEDTSRVVADIRGRLDPVTYDVNSAVKRTERMTSVVSSIGALISTVSVATMTLALVAIAFAIRFHLRSKRVAAAVLRATGAPRRLIALCFFGQTALLGIFASIVGIAGGASAYALLASIAGSALNLRISEHLDPTIALATTGFMLISLLWGAAPSIDHISDTPALAVLRSDLEAPLKSKAQRMIDLAVRILSGLSILIIAWFLCGADKSAAILLSGTAAILTFSVGLAAGARWSAKRMADKMKSFPLRFAVRNLYRPGNQTLAVVSSITLALALSSAVSILEATLDTLRGVGAEYGEANIFLYELSPEQAPQASEIVAKHGGRALQQLPVVLMRLHSLKGKPVSEIVQEDRPDSPPRWTLTREYWTSYRDHLISNERLVDGRWFDHSEASGDFVPISLEDKLAERLQLSIGDTAEWDVHGVPILTRVTSLRDILWERFERNSFVVFPPGVLEGAPQFLFWSLSIKDAVARSAFIKEVSTLLPNVSVIDLTLVVKEALSILSTIGLALKFLFGIIAFTAAGLLIITALGARAERASEFKILAHIGMRSSTKRTVVRTEFVLLGIVATACGLGLGTALAWSIANFALHVPMVFSWWGIATLTFGCLGFCWLAGRLVSS